MSKEEQYKILKKNLNEKDWRLYLATEIKSLGFGHMRELARSAKADRNTIRRGIAELEGKLKVLDDRIRNEGGGRKSIVEKDKKLLTQLEEIIEPKGDPMSLLRWTTKSLENLVTALKGKIKKSALANLLKKEGYSLKVNKKNIEGKSHPDRDEQFKYINKSCKEFESKKLPIISIDCKKKELIGNFKNNGKEWHGKGVSTVVNVYDFQSIADGKAAPYGVYDILQNTGFVNVGTDHDTASFAVESIRRWWKTVGKILYPKAKEILITSDGGGSNGVRNRLWKRELQKLVNEIKINITVNHLPPATSKWNKIEHKLFSYISVNWRGKPLTSFETVIELISNTKTKTGLTVQAVLDQNKYPTGIKISDEEFNALNIKRHAWHPDWNYTIVQQVGGVNCG